ncbi:hypothetical protein BDF14DRAFT_1752583 [Spinellus fusiger]|nr:hypothetical protein BDF14DRAFT_1752583 [Spinellus fusiger]
MLSNRAFYLDFTSSLGIDLYSYFSLEMDSKLPIDSIAFINNVSAVHSSCEMAQWSKSDSSCDTSSKKKQRLEGITSHDKTKPRKQRYRKLPHELLTEAEKKANHIASEQKRRHNIRLGFDQLIDSVPTLHHGNRSEALVLQKSIEYIQQLIYMKNNLKSQVYTLQDQLGDQHISESSEDEMSY